MVVIPGVLSVEVVSVMRPVFFQVFFCDFPESMLQGEVRQTHVEFTNTGQVSLQHLRVACTHPSFFTFGKNKKPSPYTEQDTDSVYSTLSSDRDDDHFIVETPNVKFTQRIELQDGALHPGKTVSIPMWILGPCDSKSQQQMAVPSREFQCHMMFMYESTDRSTHSKLG